MALSKIDRLAAWFQDRGYVVSLGRGSDTWPVRVWTLHSGTEIHGLETTLLGAKDVTRWARRGLRGRSESCVIPAMGSAARALLGWVA